MKRPFVVSGGDKQMPNVIAIANQKGDVGKTTTCANLGIGLV
jgi:ATPases involved in chromosome partitioning